MPFHVIEDEFFLIEAMAVAVVIAVVVAAAVAAAAASALYGTGIKMAVDEVAWGLYWCPIESHIPPSLLFNQRPGVRWLLMKLLGVCTGAR